MPRFFLHVCNGSGFTEDETGQEYADLREARDAAIDGIRDLMSAELKQGQINIASYIEIEDEDRRLMGTVTFTEAVQIDSDPCVDTPSMRRRTPKAGPW
jgi:hypothetical protein